MNKIKFQNTWKMECFERLGGKLLWSVTKKNIMPDEGLSSTFGVFVPGYSQPTYSIGLIDNAGFVNFQYADVAAQIGGTNGWAEWVSYSEVVRQAFTSVLSPAINGSVQVDNNASQAIFTMSAAGTLRGAFLVSASGKGSTSGKIFGEVNFDTGNTPVIIGNIIQVTIVMQGFA